MAHKLRQGGDQAVRTGIDVLLQRPALAILLGNICANWTTCEQLLARLYSLFLGARRKKPSRFGGEPGGVSVYFLDEVAFLIFEDALTVELRLNLIEKVVSHQLGSAHEATLNFRDKLRRTVKQCAKARNTLAHANWGLHADYPDELIMEPTNDEIESRLAYGESDFRETLAKIEATHNAIDAFTQKAIHEWLQKL